MGKGTTFANDLLALIFNGTPIADLAQNDGSGPLTDLFVSFHTSSPGASGNQSTNETAYPSYARVSVARTTGGWAAPSAGATENVNLIQFPQCGAGSATLTHVGIGTAASGAGKLLYFGALNTPLGVSVGIQPQFSAGDLTVTES